MKLSSLSLKIIALLAMTADHIGAVFFPECFPLRIIGRIAMPVFCFLIAEGYRHTRDVKKYAFRLFLFALVSALPYYLLFGWTQNVFFSLLCGLLALWLMDTYPSKKRMFFILFSLLSVLLMCDWFFVGVWMVVGFYYSRYAPKKMFFVVGIAFLLLMGTYGAYALFYGSLSFFIGNLKTQWGMFLALPLLLSFSGERGKFHLKYFFYLYYPLHLVFLYLLRLFLILH